jgi:hypothetical protein
LAREVNTVFNYCNELSLKVFERERRFAAFTDEALPPIEAERCVWGWQCIVCEAIHDRNVNAAHNILAAGHRRLAEGILVPRGREGCQNNISASRTTQTTVHREGTVADDARSLNASIV